MCFTVLRVPAGPLFELMSIMFDKWFDWLIEAPLVIQLLPLYIVLGISILTRDWLRALLMIVFCLLVYVVVRFM